VVYPDAFLSLEVVEDSIAYKSVDKAVSRKKDFRIKGFPKDGFHVAAYPRKNKIRANFANPYVVRS